MRASRLLLSVAVVTGFGMSACASVAQTSGTQTVNVQVAGATSATCTFKNDTVSEKGQFPGKLTLARSRNDVQADCTGDNNRHVAFVVPASISPAGPMNGVTNSVLPATAYDAATGGVYAYPDPLTVDFRDIGETSDASDALNPSDANAIETAAPLTVTAASHAKMQPVLEDAPVKTASATVSSASASKMKPVASPEDKMGAEPGKVKAKERAKAEAAKRAKEEAAAKKRQAAEDAAAAKRAAAEAAAAAAAAPAPVTETIAPTVAEPATTTTTTTAPAAIAPVPSTDTPPAEALPNATTATPPAPTPITPAPAGTNSDIDKYLEGQ